MDLFRRFFTGQMTIYRYKSSIDIKIAREDG
jgi:hypothetical protein